MDHQMMSLADQVFEELERRILTDVYARDTLLTESRLSEELGVSRTPIREAMNRLEAEYLLEVTGKGGRVIGVSLQDILDIYDMRIRIEGMAARKAAENVSAEGLAELKEAIDVQEFYTGRQDSDGIKNMDSRFHQTVYKLCGSIPLRYTLEPLHRRVIKYRKVSVTAPSRAASSLREHREIYLAIANRQADEAERLMVQHIRNARDNILLAKKTSEESV